MFRENFKIVVPVDEILHTPEKPFCNQTLYPDCPCREDQDKYRGDKYFFSKDYLHQKKQPE